jgi:hypothetical protein
MPEDSIQKINLKRGFQNAKKFVIVADFAA